MRLVSGQEILDIDKSVGIPSIILMENAGLSVANYILNNFQPSKVAVVAGPGNNGADGLVVARKLYTMGIDVEIFFTNPTQSYRSQEGKVNFHLATEVLKIPHNNIVPNDMRKFDVVVDAILGAGSRASNDTRIFQDIFDSINNSGSKIVAVDIPSGICPTSGSLLYQTPVYADVTITFGLVKSGLIFFPAASHVGRLVLSSICFPPDLSHNACMRLAPIPRLSPRDPRGHKGTFGKVFVLAGSKQYFGAPLFASLSFLKAGGGYARLLCEESVGAVVAQSAPEVVQLGSELTDSVKNFLTNDSDVVIIGPGMGLDKTAIDKIIFCVEALAINQNIKCVIFDGDAITLLAKNPTVRDCVSRLVSAGIQIILTPHPGELRRLFPEISSSSSDYERICSTRSFLSSSEYLSSAIVVVKGSRSATVSISKMLVNPTGNSGMATCGSGDVLCGVIAAMVSNYPGTVLEATAAAVFIHGLAGDLAAESLGEDGMVASDILSKVPEAMKKLRTDQNGISFKYSPSIV